MANRIGRYFVFVGIVLLAIALVLAMGDQPSGYMLLAGLASAGLGAWLLVRDAGLAPPEPPPPPPAPEPKAPREEKSGRPGGLAGLFQPKSKSNS